MGSFGRWEAAIIPLTLSLSILYLSFCLALRHCPVGVDGEPKDSRPWDGQRLHLRSSNSPPKYIQLEPSQVGRLAFLFFSGVQNENGQIERQIKNEYDDDP